MKTLHPVSLPTAETVTAYCPLNASLKYQYVAFHPRSHPNVQSAASRQQPLFRPVYRHFFLRRSFGIHFSLTVIITDEPLIMSGTVLWLQGIYLVLTGVWPIVHYPSFEKITGGKTDVWLVKTTGGVLTAIGCSLLAAANSTGATDLPVVIMGMGSALALLVADAYYAARRVILPVYLVDAAMQFAWMLMWYISFFVD
jgi:hypothetical protein